MRGLNNQGARNVEAKIAGYSYMMGKDIEEISDFLNYSEATIRRRLSSLEEIKPELHMSIKMMR